MKIRRFLSGLTSFALSVTALTGLSASEGIRPVKTSAAQSDWRFDFGGSGAAGGYTGVSASDGYNSGRGYGFAQTWNVSNVSAGGNGAAYDAVKFNSGDTGNTFNGPVTVMQGTVSIGADGAIPATGTVRVNGGAEFSLNNHSQSLARIEGNGTLPGIRHGQVEDAGAGRV